MIVMYKYTYWLIHNSAFTQHTQNMLLKTWGYFQCMCCIDTKLFYIKNIWHKDYCKGAGVVVVLPSCKGVRCIAYLCIYPVPMHLFVDNSDYASVVEQLSQGPSFSYNIFISDSFLALWCILWLMPCY